MTFALDAAGLRDGPRLAVGRWPALSNRLRPSATGRHNGWDVADRGRVPSNVIEAFEEARKAPAKPAGRRRRAK
ncbi:MAG TPA: hypothetical protein VJ914_01050 [Pseudonocardiaceae bacterium]|nr:hypothetical protein [Pseudonocardiaceae bacterium]